MNNQTILRRLVPRRALSQLVLLGVLLAHALMAHTVAEAAAGAKLITTRVVLSGSMEPAFERGDLLLFRGGYSESPIRAGDVVLFKQAYSDIPVVHRVIAVHERRGGGRGTADILTKGDNNGVDDASFLYRGPWLPRQHVMDKAVGYLPKAGSFSVGMAWMRRQGLARSLQEFWGWGC